MGNMLQDGFQHEKPVHKVCVSDFQMGKSTVTQKQWEAVMGNNPSSFLIGVKLQPLALWRHILCCGQARSHNLAGVNPAPEGGQPPGSKSLEIWW